MLITDSKSVQKTDLAEVAAKNGNMEAVKYLMSRGIDVNAKGGTFDANALKTGASSGQLEIVKYLLVNGSRIDISLAKTNSLFGTIYGGHLNVVQALVDRGIDISVKYTSENLIDINAYECARQYGQIEIANYLKQHLEK